MNDAEEDIARFLIPLLEIALYVAVQGLLATIEVGAKPAARLEHGEAMVVFVQDF
jgi:hypothetical protein